MDRLKQRLTHVSKSDFNDWLKYDHEIGGSVKRKRDGSYEFVPLSTGSDSHGGSSDDPWTIRIPSSKIMFHTHPLGCPDHKHKDLCGYGVPSARDLEQFLDEEKTEAHMVIAQDGVYLMENKCLGKRSRRRSPGERDKRFIQSVDQLEKQTQQPQHAADAPEYHQHWWQLYKSHRPSCIDVTHFPYQ